MQRRPVEPAVGAARAWDCGPQRRSATWPEQAPGLPLQARKTALAQKFDLLRIFLLLTLPRPP
ncbi:MAG: hypothetical protein OXU61_12415 [Gammaproteobacteria bacterium]|nr:hypothetical protein [Gammaproteobacteria bacterium]